MNGTIHIFGYGEAQIISKDVNFKAPVGSFTKLQAVIADVKSKMPAGKTVAEHHAINIFGDLRADFQAKSAEGAKPMAENTGSFSVPFSDLNATKLNALIAEFATLASA